jgi:CBS domain-containing protein
MTAVDATEARALKDVRVVDAMHPGVLTCPPDAPLEAVAEMMAAYEIHCVVVFKDPDETKLERTLWGIVSDLDLISIASAEGTGARTAGESAVTPAVLISPDDPLARAAQLMREYSTTHLVVADPGAGEPLGILSTLDIARAIAHRRS